MSVQTHCCSRTLGAWCIALVFAVSACTAAVLRPLPSASDGLPPLIPLKLLLGNSKYRNPQLSPDGKYLAYIRPSGPKNVYNVFIKQLPQPGQASKLNTGVSLFDQQGVDVDRQVTFDQKRGVQAYSFGETGEAIYYIQDNNGDENDHLYVVPLAALEKASPGNPPKPVDLTPFPGVKADGIVGSKRFPDRLYVGLNKRNPEVFDQYRLDLKTGKLTLDTVNPGDVSSWLYDYDFEIKGAQHYNNTDGAAYVTIKDPPKPQQASSKTTAESSSANGGGSSNAEITALFKAAAKGNWSDAQWISSSTSKSDASKWRKLITWPFGEDGGVFRMNKEGNGLYIVNSIGRDTTEFQLVGMEPGAPVKQRIASNPLVNVGSVMFDPDEWIPQLISFSYLKTNWTVLDKSMQKDWDLISKYRPGDTASISDISNDRKTWILLYGSDNRTSRYYLYHPGHWPPQLLLEVQPALNPYKLAKMHPVVITARDGLRLPSYLTLPVKAGVPTELPASVVGSVPDTTKNGVAGVHFGGKPDYLTATSKPKPLNLNLPLILYVHGGPWARDSWGADSVVQWLANRGYAVLQVNYRGSTGFGKQFLNAGNGQWGVGSMQHDLTDSVKWAIAKGIADPKRVCIFGGSYGGYATLAGLAFTPELYRCGVDLVGISNAATFMKSIPPYWKPLRYEWATRVGDAEKNETLNRIISPFYHVQKIRAPLLIGQGANDVRVPQAESDQMFQAMKERNLDVQYVLYPDEGHGLVRQPNRLDFYSRADNFFAKHLGGRSEPLLSPPDSSAQVITKVDKSPLV